MKTIRKTINGIVGGIVLVLCLYAAYWGVGQRGHGKEYWLIFAHVIPFVLLVLAGAGLVLFIAHWCLRRIETKSPREG